MSIFEIYCRYPGCSISTRYGQPCALLDHYQIKHDLELKAFKTSIGPVGRKQHEACKTSQDILMYTKHKLILTCLTNLRAFHPATGPVAQKFADKPNDIDDVEWNKIKEIPYVKVTTTKFNDCEKVFFIPTHIARRPKDPKYTPKPVEDTATSTPGHRHLTKHTAINRQGSPEARDEQPVPNSPVTPCIAIS
ncbi:hypothetical protein PENPOL_c004G00738 [Penicillium polonicum]|uniref:Uncharacterized protein n=1 Tax=Penicillium polonicum TaxID=60169 RepID=A0A1V6NPN4_PENPO|nr:hypothetical protein PENPOL_c004G00738 [Penicillium polonicum]